MLLCEALNEPYDNKWTQKYDPERIRVHLEEKINEITINNK